jgi:hypothetical protein
VAGGGYFDHTRSTVQPLDLARGWVRFRVLRGEKQLLLLAREGQDGKFTPTWLCDGAACRDYADYKVVRERGGKRPSFHVRLADAAEPIEIRTDRFIYRDAPIEDLGLLGKVIMPFTGNPVTYVFRAQASASGGPPVEGILEVELKED